MHPSLLFSLFTETGFTLVEYLVANMSEKIIDPDVHPVPVEDEVSLTLRVDWSKDEEARAKRKYVTFA